MKITENTILNALQFNLTNEEMRYTQMYLMEKIVDKASSALLDHQKWVSWVMKQVKTGKLVAAVQEKVAAAIAEKITKEILK